MRNFNNEIENKSRLKSKYGISMAILVITIAIGLILISVGIVTVSHAINDASKTAFAEELNTIQSQVRAYYTINDELPVQTSGDNLVTIDKSEIESTLSSIDNNAKNAFDTELVSNGENTNSTFYVVDLSKLDLDKVTRGNKTEGENDIYIVSPATNIVYYLLGVEISNEYYFSLSERLISYTNTNLEIDENNNSFDIQTSGSLSVKRLKKSWTNKLNIVINANVTGSETIFLDINGTQYTMASDNYHVGDNSISIDNLFTGTNNLASMLTNSSNLESNVRAASSITIKKGSDSVTLDISNLDLDNPTVSDEVTIDNTASTKTNKVTFSVSDSNNGSGIKEVRYDYLTKYDEDGEVTYNYKNGNEDIDAIDKYYIKAKGKKASVSNEGKVSIEVPKNIEAVQILAIDKAGNMSEETRGIEKVVPIRNVAGDVYIGTTLKSMTKEGITFKIALRVNNQSELGYLTDYNISVGTDVNDLSTTHYYTINDEYIYSGVIGDFQKDINVSDKVYIAIETLTESSPSLYEQIFEYSIEDAKNLVNISYVDDVPIPRGFVASSANGENKKNTGLVIYEGSTPVTDDNVNEARLTRNQFVWVPVNNISEFVREDGQYQRIIEIIDTSEPYITSGIEKTDYDKMYESVKRFKGFYIARYESSKNVDKSVAQSLKNKDPWTNIAWADCEEGEMNVYTGGAYEEAKKVYPEDSASIGYPVSTLCYGVQWDQTLKFIKKNNSSAEQNSSQYGNYKSNSLIKTGSNENYKLNNIYDMAGNCVEWTVEANNVDFHRVKRGGDIQDYMTYSISTRTSDPANYTDPYQSFRIALYIK